MGYFGTFTREERNAAFISVFWAETSGGKEPIDDGSAQQIDKAQVIVAHAACLEGEIPQSGRDPNLVNSREPRWRSPELALENISPRHELWKLHWPQPPTTKAFPLPISEKRYFPHASPTPPPRNKSFFSRLPSLESTHPSPPFQFDAFVAPRRAASSSSRVPGPRSRLLLLRQRFQQHHGRGIRRRRVDVLLLRAPRHPQERLGHRHTHRVPEARDEVAPGPVGQRPRRGRRGQAAVPADPGGVLRFVGQGEEGHVRRRALRSPRRRRPGFLRLHAGDACDDG